MVENFSIPYDKTGSNFTKLSIDNVFYDQNTLDLGYPLKQKTWYVKDFCLQIWRGKIFEQSKPD